MTVSRALSLETWSVVVPYCCVTSIPNSRRGFRRQVLEAEPEILVKPDGVPVNRRVVGSSPTCGASACLPIFRKINRPCRTFPVYRQIRT
jgi:hypothetical protein